MGRSLRASTLADLAKSRVARTGKPRSSFNQTSPTRRVVETWFGQPACDCSWCAGHPFHRHLPAASRRGDHVDPDAGRRSDRGRTQRRHRGAAPPGPTDRSGAAAAAGSARWAWPACGSRRGRCGVRPATARSPSSPNWRSTSSMCTRRDRSACSACSPPGGWGCRWCRPTTPTCTPTSRRTASRCRALRAGVGSTPAGSTCPGRRCGVDASTAAGCRHGGRDAAATRWTPATRCCCATATRWWCRPGRCWTGSRCPCRTSASSWCPPASARARRRRRRSRPCGAGTASPPADRVLLFVGRINREKGIDLLIDAFARVVAAASGGAAVAGGRHVRAPVVSPACCARSGRRWPPGSCGPASSRPMWSPRPTVRPTCSRSRRCTDTQALVLQEAALAGLPAVLADPVLHRYGALAGAAVCAGAEPGGVRPARWSGCSTTRPRRAGSGRSAAARAAEHTPARYARGDARRVRAGCGTARRPHRRSGNAGTIGSRAGSLTAVDVLVVDHPLARTRLTAMRDERTDSGVVPRRTARADHDAGLRGRPRDERGRVRRSRRPVGPTVGHRVAHPPLLVPVLRAGLGMSDAALALLPESSMGFVGLARDEHTFEPRAYLESLPADLTGIPVMVLDPMLATGGSLEHCVRLIASRGCRTSP